MLTQQARTELEIESKIQLFDFYIGNSLVLILATLPQVNVVFTGVRLALLFKHLYNIYSETSLPKMMKATHHQ